MKDSNPSTQQLLEFYEVGRKLAPTLEHDDPRYFLGDEYRVNNTPISASGDLTDYEVRIEAVKRHHVYKYLSASIYFKEALKRFSLHHYDNKAVKSTDDVLYRERAAIWLMCIVAMSFFTYRCYKEKILQRPTKKETKKAAQLVSKVKKLAEIGQLHLPAEKNTQLISLLTESYGGLERYFVPDEFRLKFSKLSPTPRLNCEYSYVSNLCHAYYYQYRLIHTDVIDSLSKIALLDISDETIKEWMGKIVLRPPFRFPEDWDEDAGEFKIEEDEEE